MFKINFTPTELLRMLANNNANPDVAKLVAAVSERNDYFDALSSPNTVKSHPVDKTLDDIVKEIKEKPFKNPNPYIDWPTLPKSTPDIWKY